MEKKIRSSYRTARSEFATYKAGSKGDTLAVFPFFLPFWQQHGKQSKASSSCPIFPSLLLSVVEVARNYGSFLSGKVEVFSVLLVSLLR